MKPAIGMMIEVGRMVGILTRCGRRPTRSVRISLALKKMPRLSLSKNSPPLWTYGHSFGSAHPSGVNAVFGDGSVHAISYDIDPLVFNLLGNSADGEVVSLDGL